MKKLKVRVATAIVSFAVVASLAGCATGTTAATPTNEGPRDGLEARDSQHIPANWGEIEQAAIAEGEVVIYTTTPAEQFDPIADAFNAIYPEITVTRVSDAMSTLAVRYEQERAAGTKPADILASSSFEAVIEAHPDWFTDIAKEDAEFLPNLADFSPLVLPKDRPRSLTLGAYTWRVAYNTDLVKEADLPKTFKDLANAKWAGRLGIVDPRNSDTYATVFESLRAQYGDAYLEALAKNGFTLTKEATDTAQQVAAGSIAIGFPTNQSKAASFIAAGAPMALLDLAPYPIGATTMAMPLDAPHPNAGRLFANFLLTAQAQEMQCELVKVGSLNLKAAAACEEFSVVEDAKPLDYSLTQGVRDNVFELLGLQ